PLRAPCGARGGGERGPAVVPRPLGLTGSRSPACAVVTFSLVTRGGHPDFLDLPWDVPLERWDHPRLVTMAHGVSRHVVRFVAYGSRVYALKETVPAAAERELRALRALRQRSLPVVDGVGV